MKKCVRILLCVACTATLCACSGLLTSDQPPDRVYWLEAATLRLGEPPSGALPDLVISVGVLPGLDTDRILVRGPGAQLNYYAGARWPDHLPEILTVTVRLSLESSAYFNRVSSGSQLSRADWSLDLELREFFAVVTTSGQPPDIHVKLVGHLDCGSRNAAVSAAATAPARENRLSDIIGAFQSATDNAIASLGEQLADHCFGKDAQHENQPMEQ